MAPGSRSLRKNRYASEPLSDALLDLINEMKVHERDLENLRRRLIREYLPESERGPLPEFYEPLPPLSIPPKPEKS